MRDIEANLALLSVRAQMHDGRPAPDARVQIDGAAVATDRSIWVNPGKHSVRAESSGASPLEQEVVVSPGDRREIVATLEALPAEPAQGRSVGAAPPARPSASEPPLVFVLGGLGAALAVAGGVLDAKGYFWDTLPLRQCSPHCKQGEVDTARHELLAGDILLGVGVALVGVAAWIHFTRPTARSNVGSLVVGPHGAGVAF